MSMPQSLPGLSPGMPWPAAAYAGVFIKGENVKKLTLQLFAISRDNGSLVLMTAVLNLQD